MKLTGNNKVLFFILSFITIYLTLFFSPGIIFTRNELINLYNLDKDENVIKEVKNIGVSVTGINAYVIGKSYYNHGDFILSSLYLKKSISKGNPLYKDHALYFIGKSEEKNGGLKKAFSAYAELTKKHKNSIYYKKALIKSAETSFKLGFYKTAYLKYTKSLSSANYYQKSARLYKMAECMRKSGRLRKASIIFYRALSMEDYGKYNRKVLNGLKLIPKRFHPKGIKSRIIFARSLIIRGRESKAWKLLKKIKRSSINYKKNDKNHVRIERTLSWINRRRKEWKKAERILVKLKNSGKDQLGVLNDLFYLEFARKNYDKAVKYAQMVYSLDKKRAYSIYKDLSAGFKRSYRLPWKYNYLAVKKFPGSYYFKNNLFLIIARAYINRKFNLIISMGRKYLKLDVSNQSRSGINFFLEHAYRAVRRFKRAKMCRIALVESDPLGYYHLQAEKSYRYTFSNKELSLKRFGKMNLRKLSARYLLCRYSQKSRIKKEILLKWKSSKLKKIISEDSPNPGLVRYFIDSANRERFYFFWDKGLYKEAYYEVSKRLYSKAKKFVDYPNRAIFWMAQIAQKANFHGSVIYNSRVLMRKMKIDNHMAVVEKLSGGTFFTKFYPLHFKKDVLKNAKKYRINPLFLFALIRQESAFNPKAESWAGAVGLMQLMPSTANSIADKLGINEIYLKNSKVNIRLGSNFVGWLKKAYKKEIFTLIGYNAGPNRIGQWKRWYRRRHGRFDRVKFVEYVPFTETRNYIKKVLSNFNIYKFLYKNSDLLKT